MIIIWAVLCVEGIFLNSVKACQLLRLFQLVHWITNASINVQVKFHIKDMIFRIHDVGGQRSERRKWLYLFDCVHAVRVVIIVNHVTMRVWESVYQYGLRLIYNIQVCIHNQYTYVTTVVINSNL